MDEGFASEADVAALIDGFAAAALDGGRWLPSLARLADLTGSGHGQLIGIGGADATPFNWVSDFSDTAADPLLEVDGYSPTVNYRVAAGLARPMAVAWEEDYRRLVPTMRSDIYLDYAATVDIPHGCQTVLVQEPGLLIGLALLRRGRDGPTTAAVRDLFARVAPHVRAAVRTQRAIESQGAELMAGALDAMHAAAFLCDGAGQVQAMTASAERALDRGGPVALSAGRLRAMMPADDRRLARALAAALFTPAPATATVALATADGEQRLVEVLPLPSRAWSLGFLPRAMVVIRGEAPPAAALAPALVAAHGLTAAEADVALALAQGTPRDRIAAARGTSLGTVRSQIKAIFRKLDVGRESELVALLARHRGA